MVEESDTDGMTNVFKDFLCKRRAVCVRIELGIGILHSCVLFDATLGLHQLGSQSVDAFAVMVIALKRVAVSQIGGLLERHPTAPISAHTILIFDGHNSL